MDGPKQRLVPTLRRGRKAAEPASDGPPRLRPRPEAARPRISTDWSKRLLRPLPLAGLVLVLVALVGYWAVYSATTSRTPILVAAHEVPAGQVLGAGDLTAAELAGDGSVIAGLVRESDLPTVVGRRVSTTLPSGMPLARSALGGPADGPSAFTLSVPALRALGGALQPGDRVTVLATYGAGSARAQARAVARSLEVLAVGTSPSDLDRENATVPVTLALPDPGIASALALANSEAKVDLLREGAGAGGAPIPPATTGGGP